MLAKLFALQITGIFVTCVALSVVLVNFIYVYYLNFNL